MTPSELRSFRFDDPLWLIALVLIPLVAWLESRRTRQRSLLFSSASLLAALPKSFAERFVAVLPWLRHLAFASIVVALARPQLGRSEFRVRTDGIAIALAIDRSGSMDALDFLDDRGQPINRLSAVKRAVHSFVEGDGGKLLGRRDDSIGLIVFGGFAEQRCPLTLDHGALLDVLDKVEIPGSDLPLDQQRRAQDLLREESATAIGDALVRAVGAVKDAKQKSRIVILLSDGGNTAGVIEPPQAAQLAKEQGIKVYTIGIGTTGRALFKMRDEFGREVLTRQNVELDEQTLRDIADTTGAKYWNARTTGALAEVYDTIGKLEKSEIESLYFSEYDDLFEGPLALAIVFLTLEIAFAITRFARLP